MRMHQFRHVGIVLAIAVCALAASSPCLSGESRVPTAIDEYLESGERPDVPVKPGVGPPSEVPASEAVPMPSGTDVGPTEAPPSADGAGLIPPPPETVVAVPEIEWRVENPFRYFKNPADTEVHRATYLALSPEEKRTPVLSAERALAGRHDEGWAATMVDETCWNAGRNRHVCKEGTPYIDPVGHVIILEAKGIEDGDVECTWLTSPRGGKSLRGTAIRKPCREPVSIEAPYPGGAGITLEVGGQEVARADVRVRDILIAALGDSFGSGEGNPDVPVRFSKERAVDYAKAEKHPDLAGYPARVGSWKQIGDKNFIEANPHWLDQACHRSLYSHQTRAALQLAIEDPHRAVTFVNVACSGAEVTFGLFLRYKGNEWVPNPPELSQISAIAEAQCGSNDAPFQDLPEAFHIKGTISELQGGLTLRRCDRKAARNIDLLFVSIGGNDIGFARLVANSVLADQSLVRQLGGWFGQVHGNAESKALMERLDERYKALNRAAHYILHIPWEESDRVILAAYPPLAVLDEKNNVCPDGVAGMEVYSEFSLSEERARASSLLANQLQTVMVKSAEVHSWTLADAHRKAFLGRGICAGYTDNAFSIADDLRIPRKVNGSWQPYNPADYKAYVSRQRWFRTPNDAFLTANFHVSGNVIQKALKLQSLSWFQVLLASTYGGAFHPTAEGHAAIADSVADKARRVLAKYKQSSAAALLP
jgi:lysophospholipase L1-like esterase